jgi:cytochrome o ubiquinol oxidase subunit 2
MTLKATLFGFFVPQLAGQIYTMAGMVTRLNMRADNKKTLETLGLTIPAATLLRADEIIE